MADDYSIADIANWCWARTYKWSGVSVDGLDHFQRWLKAMANQPGMTQGIEVPVSLANLQNDEKEQEKFKASARAVLQK